MNGILSNAAFEQVLHRDDSQGPAPIESPDLRPLQVTVLFTGVSETLRAMENAAEMARGLNATLRLLVAYVVPYQRPVEAPPVLVEFQEALFREIALESDLETRVNIVLCRDVQDAFRTHLSPRSVVVLGSPSHWWRTREERVARRLRRLGHEVFVVYPKRTRHA
jgi:hypothetical protein